MKESVRTYLRNRRLRRRKINRVIRWIVPVIGAVVIASLLVALIPTLRENIEYCNAHPTVCTCSDLNLTVGDCPRANPFMTIVPILIGVGILLAFVSFYFRLTARPLIPEWLFK